MGIPIFSLVESQKGRGSQTWVHSRIALKLAAWLSPNFEVWVYSVIEKLLRVSLSVRWQIGRKRREVGVEPIMISVRYSYL
jgi:KilA-N domain